MRARLGTVSVIVAAMAVMLTGCSDDGDGGNSATVEMKDYSYEISGSLEAGTSTVELRNTGKELHMVAFGRLNEGKTLTDVRNALNSEDEAAFGQVFAEEIDAPGGFLSPGATAKVTTPFLSRGNYALICFIPTEGEGAPHFTKGMINQLSVGSGNASATPDVDQRITITNGKIDGPNAMKAGETTFAVTSSGTDPHEFLVIKKKNPGVTFEQLDTAITGAFEGQAPPPRGFAEQLPATIVGSTFDIASGSTIYMTVDLTPGNYLIGCARMPDEDNAPTSAPHRELLEITVT